LLPLLPETWPTRTYRKFGFSKIVHHRRKMLATGPDWQNLPMWHNCVGSHRFKITHVQAITHYPWKYVIAERWRHTIWQAELTFIHFFQIAKII